MRRDAATQTYAYFSGTNRVRNTGGNLSTYLYDRRGNVTTLTPRGITDVDYDPFTSLPTSLTTGGATTTYGYLGRRRVFKAAPGQEKVLYLHGASGQPFAERTPTGLRLFVRGPDGLVAMRTFAAQSQPPEGGTQAINYVTDVYHVASDHLGSTRVMVDEDGELVEAYSYGAWGEVAASVQLGAGVGYTFTGQEEDTESGLMNYRARLYDPALGRFLGVDPAGQFASPYLYGANSPTMTVDPDGELAFLASVAISAAVSGGIAYAKGARGIDLARATIIGGVMGGAGLYNMYHSAFAGAMASGTMTTQGATSIATNRVIASVATQIGMSAVPSTGNGWADAGIQILGRPLVQGVIETGLNWNSSLDISESGATNGEGGAGGVAYARANGMGAEYAAQANESVDASGRDFAPNSSGMGKRLFDPNAPIYEGRVNGDLKFAYMYEQLSPLQGHGAVIAPGVTNYTGFQNQSGGWGPRGFGFLRGTYGIDGVSHQDAARIAGGVVSTQLWHRFDYSNWATVGVFGPTGGPVTSPRKTSPV